MFVALVNGIVSVGVSKEVRRGQPVNMLFPLFKLGNALLNEAKEEHAQNMAEQFVAHGRSELNVFNEVQP